MESVSWLASFWVTVLPLRLGPLAQVQVAFGKQKTGDLGLYDISVTIPSNVGLELERILERHCPLVSAGGPLTLLYHHGFHALFRSTAT
jgi:hypothetical protein